MTDATLPPPRSSSVGSTSEGRERSNSSQSREEFDVSGEQSSDPANGEGTSGDSESRAENKQRRKRTRYVLYIASRGQVHCCHISPNYFSRSWTIIQNMDNS